jgi:hypothetical protein
MVELWCEKCNRLMVEHNNNTHVCLGCEAMVKVKIGGLQRLRTWDAKEKSASELI